MAEGDHKIELLDPNAKDDSPRNALIYGQPGSGKTSLGATAPKPLIVDLERGAPASVKAAGNKDARVTQAENLDDVRRVFAYLKAGDHKFQSVVIDPIGELQKFIMADIIERYGNVRRAYDNQPAMSDYGKMINDTTKLVTAFRSLPLSTVIIAHAEIPDHEDDMVKPLVTGKKFGPFLQGAFDLLGYLYVEMNDENEPVRKLQTVSTHTVIAKNRGGRLSPVIVDPNLTEIFKQMRE